MADVRPQIKIPPPGPKAKALIEKDDRVTSPSYIKEYPLVIDRGEGSFVYDVDGNKYLDLMAGIAVTSTGYNHPKVVNAIKSAADKFLHICFTDFYYESAIDICSRLANVVPGMGPKKVFLTNSGTEAVEGAIKLARYHTKRTNIIAFHGAFHGRTYGAISLNSSKAKQRAFFGPLMPGVHHVPYANPYRCPNHKPANFCAQNCTCTDFIEKDLFNSRVDPKEVAAIFIEPVLGEGGYVVPPLKFLQDLRRICDKHGILLVFDEIQSGVGRTGEMFAAETLGVSPDIILAAKGLASGMPLGAIIARESVMTWSRGTHGSTFGGNPVSCAAGVATLEVVEGLLPHIRETGKFALGEAQKLKLKHPKCIGDVRGLGLMVGIEFVEQDGSPATELVGKLEQMAFRKGLLLLSCGQSTIRLAPPLVITQAELRVGFEIMSECISELTK